MILACLPSLRLFECCRPVSKLFYQLCWQLLRQRKEIVAAERPIEITLRETFRDTPFTPYLIMEVIPLRDELNFYNRNFILEPGSDMLVLHRHIDGRKPPMSIIHNVGIVHPVFRMGRLVECGFIRHEGESLNIHSNGKRSDIDFTRTVPVYEGNVSDLFKDGAQIRDPAKSIGNTKKRLRWKVIDPTEFKEYVKHLKPDMFPEEKTVARKRRPRKKLKRSD